MFRDNFHSPAKIISHGFLIQVDAEEGTSVEAMKDHLGDACTWMEGVGKTDVEYMGVIPEVEDDH